MHSNPACISNLHTLKRKGECKNEALRPANGEIRRAAEATEP